MDQDKLLSIQQAAKILKGSTKTLRRWEARGILIPQRTQGSHRRYTQSQINSFWQGINKKKSRETSQEPIDLFAVFPPVNITKKIVEKSQKSPELSEAVGQLVPVSKKKVIFISAFASLIALLLLSSIFAAVLIPLKSKTEDQKEPVSQKIGEDILGLSVGRAKYLFRVNVPTSFSQDAEFLKGISVSGIATTSGGIDTQNFDVDAGTGSVFASNLIYGLVAGDGIAIGPGQTPTVTNTGVLSVGGQTGAVSLTAGTGISISGTKITNTSTGSVEDTFKRVLIGSDTITASGTNDELEFAAGTGISLSADTTNKTVTITSTATGGSSNWRILSGGLSPV